MFHWNNYVLPLFGVMWQLQMMLPHQILKWFDAATSNTKIQISVSPINFPVNCYIPISLPLSSCASINFPFRLFYWLQMGRGGCFPFLCLQLSFFLSAPHTTHHIHNLDSCGWFPSLELSLLCCKKWGRSKQTRKTTLPLVICSEMKNTSKQEQTVLHYKDKTNFWVSCACNLSWCLWNSA